MKTYWFTEDCYPDIPPLEELESVRVNLPNSICDPQRANELYNWYLDLWCMAEEKGLDIMNNEHHQTVTCMVPAAPLMLAILARETKTARRVEDLMGRKPETRFTFIQQNATFASEQDILDI